MSSQQPVVEKAGAVVVQENSGKIAVIVNEFGMTVLPKGGLEPGETLLEAAYREVSEETGLTELDSLGELGAVTRRGHASAVSSAADIIKEIHFFLFVTGETLLSPVTSDSVQAKWLGIDTAIAALSWSEEATFIRNHREKITQVTR